MRIIYKSRRYDPKNELYWSGTHFIPVFDSTDHFHFVCARCEEIATILQVKRDDTYAHTPTIYFIMQCPRCGKCNIRKIYLEDAGKHYMVCPTKVELLAKTPEESKPGIHKRS